VRPKPELIRFVVGPDAQIVPDILARLPGRGIWVSADRASLELARKKKAFGRSAKTQVTVPENLADQVEGLLLGRVTSLLALSRKAGHAICGYEKVKGALITEWALILLQASDGSERGKSKLRTPEGGRFIGHLTATELGLAFGRDHVIHAALTAGGLTTRIVEDAARLKGLRDGKTADTSAGKELGNA
jgi:predicted RNA-binding protein YlxR (DUF448 family)